MPGGGSHTETKARVQAALDGRDPRFGARLLWGLYGVILLSALVITLESMQNLPPLVHRLLGWAEFVLLGVFAAEYLLRLWVAPSRWRYALSFWGIVDLLSVLPGLVLLQPQTQSLRVLRLMRVFRLLKLFRLRRASRRLEQALHASRDELILFTAVAVLVLFVASVGIHVFEHEAQPDKFGSIPQCMWWALATLSTVGYGDVYPITTGGRIFTGLTVLIGVGIVAIPAGIITSELLRQKRRPERAAGATQTETKTKTDQPMGDQQ
ncbi:ion transporter [Salipiger bermudensis]|uniref:ion transporter n=1 Tax=Salipiger bermudensis TaxID=344736 RepID=UPI001CD37806|nr:ion transporter [Salipiger bermudensis]MCA0964312.1 ion transporter [Salipiger bermudensis]